MLNADWEDSIADFTENVDLAAATTELTTEVKRLLAEKTAIRNFFKIRFAESPTDHHFAHFTNRRWRKFLLSVYYADLLSYPVQEDQVDFPRLCYILNCAPQGFTVWWAEFANGKQFPVGYTGWYCVDEALFQQVAALQERQERRFHHRFFLPAKQKTAYFYLFNYSIVHELKGTHFSSQMIKEFAAEIQSMTCLGLFCATVSGDGSRVAEKFGMKKVGALWSAEGAVTDSIYLWQSGYE